MNKQLVVTKAEPKDPKYLPNNPARQEPITDKKINSKYIKFGFKTNRLRAD
jgi:hypothetical protein